MGLGEYVIEARKKNDVQILKTVRHLRARIEKLEGAPKPVSKGYISTLRGKLADYVIEGAQRGLEVRA